MRQGTKYFCYSILPLLSVVLILGASWVIAALLEFYTNNLTMLKTLDRSVSKSATNIIPKPPFPDDKHRNIFTFVQITDLHISKYRNYGQIPDLKQFCNTTLKKIQPEVVLITGDLTDAKDLSLRGSRQYVEEWKSYSSVIKYCRTKSNAKWLDLKGNHDAFKMPKIPTRENLFSQYSESLNSYDENGVHTNVHKTSFGSYGFVGIDLTPNPGPGRPFNFFGIPRKELIDKLKEMQRSPLQTSGTIWFGHYPLSATTMPHELRFYISNGIAYLCGHLHTMLGTFPQIHAVHSAENFMELELGDWKENRRFRVGVFDHDVFSFTNVEYPLQTPLVIFTNPVDSRYAIPAKNPIMKAKESTHVRMLIFPADNAIINVQVLINEEVGCKRAFFEENLYTCPWSPAQYSRGLHRLKVIVQDSTGKVFNSSIDFSLDGTRTPLTFWSIILLMTDFCTVLRMIYLVVVALTILCPLQLKAFSHKWYIGVIRDIIKSIIPQYEACLKCNRVFWILFVYNCYIAIGPFSIGCFVDDNLGYAFAFGIYTDAQFLSGTLTYLYVAEQLLTFNAVMLLYLGERLNKLHDISLRRLFTKGNINEKLRPIFFQFMFACWIFYQLQHIRTYYIAYGLLASLINPLKTWSLLLAFYLVCRT